MNATIDSADGPGGEKIFLAIENDSRIQTIASAHRVEAVRIFFAEYPALRMVSLRKETLSGMKSSVVPTPSTMMLLQEILMKLEDEAMRLFQTLRSHRDEVLRMFESGAHASDIVALRRKSLSAMESVMAAHPTSRPALQELLGDAEDEATAAYDRGRPGPGRGRSRLVRAAEEHDGDGVAPPFKSTRGDPEQAEPGAGGGRSSSPLQEGESRDEAEDTVSVWSLGDEPREREAHVAIVEENRWKADEEGDEKDDEWEHYATLKSFKGVKKTRANKYRASIMYQGKMYYVGTYELLTDAAFAYDEASQTLRGSTFAINFSDKTEHIAMREKEMKTNGLNVNLENVLEKISLKVRRLFSKVRAPTKPSAGSFDRSCNTNVAVIWRSSWRSS